MLLKKTETHSNKNTENAIEVAMFDHERADQVVTPPYRRPT